MDPAQRFYALVSDWDEHCLQDEIQFDPSPGPIFYAESYKKLQAMGEEILPLIREVYGMKEGIYSDTLVYYGLPALVSKVTKEEFHVPDHLRNDLERMRSYVEDWIDVRLAK